MLPSDCAKTTVDTAKTVLTWAATHKSEVQRFEESLVSSLDSCLKHARVKSEKINRERMWCAYHHLRTSDRYISDWETFLQAVGISKGPVMLYQCIGDHVFKQLIRFHFPVRETEDACILKSALTYMEMNAIRYAAGYIPRSLDKTLSKSSHPLKRDLRLCLGQLVDDNDEDPCLDDSKDWMHKINRGGLINVNNDTYELFIAMEQKLRMHIASMEAKKEIPCFTEKTKEEIMMDPNVQFIWHLLSTEWEEEIRNTLLKMIISEWVKIRGFSFASSWIEKYKDAQKITIQKSKGLRKQLQSN